MVFGWNWSPISPLSVLVIFSSQDACLIRWLHAFFDCREHPNKELRRTKTDWSGSFSIYSQHDKQTCSIFSLALDTSRVDICLLWIPCRVLYHVTVSGTVTNNNSYREESPSYLVSYLVISMWGSPNCPSFKQDSFLPAHSWQQGYSPVLLASHPSLCVSWFFFRTVRR